jgi:hypothetical protein
VADPRPLEELRDSGLLWLINRVLFHPRGRALALHVDEEGHIVGWSLVGDGSEPWRYDLSDADEREVFERAEQTLREAAPGG